MNSCCTPATTTHATNGGATAAPAQTTFFSPAADVIELENEIRIVADVPGASAQSIELDLENGELTITARVAPRTPEGATALVREFRTGDYRRTFRLGKLIDHSAISAEVSGGVLTVHLPKAEQAKPRKIAVSAATA